MLLYFQSHLLHNLGILNHSEDHGSGEAGHGFWSDKHKGEKFINNTILGDGLW